MTDYFKINGVPLDGRSLPEPAHGGATFSVQDIDSSETGRNQNGEMMRERVATKIKWQFSFPPLSRKMGSAILNAVSGVTIEFSYPDPFSETGSVTKTCYVGDRSAPSYSTADGVPLWNGISFSVIEM